jgi:hypothetical protein
VASAQSDAGRAFQTLSMGNAVVGPLLLAGALRAAVACLARTNAGRRVAPAYFIWRALTSFRADIVAAGALPGIVDCISDDDEFGLAQQALTIAIDLVLPATSFGPPLDVVVAAVAADPRQAEAAHALTAAGALAPLIARLCAGAPDDLGDEGDSLNFAFALSAAAPGARAAIAALAGERAFAAREAARFAQGLTAAWARRAASGAGS